jgi:hypothetical protein
MGNPFQDQLLKAGLVSKKQANKANREKYLSRKKNKGNKENTAAAISKSDPVAGFKIRCSGHDGKGFICAIVYHCHGQAVGVRVGTDLFHLPNENLVWVPLRADFLPLAVPCID